MELALIFLVFFSMLMGFSTGQFCLFTTVRWSDLLGRTPG